MTYQKIKQTSALVVIVLLIIEGVSSAQAQTSTPNFISPPLMVLLEEEGLSFKDCSQLIIPSFSSTTGFPAAIPDPFHIGLVDDCPAFLSGSTVDGKSTVPTTSSAANGALVQLVTNRGSGTSAVIAWVNCNWSPIPGQCRKQNHNLAAFEFATDQGFTCTGALDLWGTQSSPRAYAYSREISLNCAVEK